MKSEELAKELKEKNVEVDNLFVLYTGAEQLIGELEVNKWEHPAGAPLKNPKRVLRLQQAVEGGVVISLMIGDFDFMAAGSAVVVPHIYYQVSEQSEETKVNIYGSYLDYFKRRAANRAEEAGLVIPKTNLSPFRKG